MWGEMMLVDYHVHALSHGEYMPHPEWYREYMMRAAACGIAELGFSEHDDYIDLVKPEMIRDLASFYSPLAVRVGMEMEFRHALSEEMQRRLKEMRLDYLIGSVHFLQDWNFDHPDQRTLFDGRDIDLVYEQYFAEVKAMIESGLFDIVGHLDLIKIWGYRPKKAVKCYVGPLLKTIRRYDMAVEINSGGLRKPVAEIYPEPGLLKELFAANIPVTLGSDAHHPDQVGEQLDRVLGLVKRAGYRKLAGFKERNMYLLNI